MNVDLSREWLESDGLGGFASGTAAGIRTRRYHALLLASVRPPGDRVVLVNGVDAWIEGPFGRVALSTHEFAPGVLHPDAFARLVSFDAEPWPTWTYALPDGARVVHEVLVRHGRPAVLVAWRLEGASEPCTLSVRPLVSGRDPHHLLHEDARHEARLRVSRGRIVFELGDARVTATTDASYLHEPTWYRKFLYRVERERGLDDGEDLFSPGTFSFPLAPDGEAALVLAADDVREGPGMIRETERSRRAAFGSSLHRAADAYVVARGDGATIVAGYPWFLDWGRDTFIALRGLLHGLDRVGDAGAILATWAAHVSEGMLPNRFPDRGETPEHNSVDASLWFVIAACEHLARAPIEPRARAIREAIAAILRGYAAGTRHGIRLDDDGLLACGETGSNLTWMDAKVGDRPVTPRVGKPVEVQALWLNALALAGDLVPELADAVARGRAAFTARFVDPAREHLADVVDVDHQAGTVDATLRPSQILAVGGLPHVLVDRDVARRVVDVVERELWTPLGLRTLGPREPGYAGRYEGGPAERDARYHEGTAWPWLLGAFVDAWLRVRGRTSAAKTEAAARFVAPLRAHLSQAGIGHVSEIADGDAPHTPRGCPFQAWSVGELVRMEQMISL